MEIQEWFLPLKEFTDTPMKEPNQMISEKLASKREIMKILWMELNLLIIVLIKELIKKFLLTDLKNIELLTEI